MRERRRRCERKWGSNSRSEENSAAESKEKTGSKPSTVSMSHFGGMYTFQSHAVCLVRGCGYSHLSVLILGPFHLQAIAISV